MATAQERGDGRRPHRTIELRVRVRSLVLWAAVIAVLATVGWGLGIVTSTASLQAGASMLGGGVPVVAHTQDRWNQGQPVYQWTCGRSVIEALWIANTGRLAVWMAATCGFFWVAWVLSNP